MKHVSIHTDGGCRGNPGIGAWAAVLEHKAHRKEISGGELATTNNRMELRAAIEALRRLKEPCLITLHTDSKYLQDGITRWIRGWKRNGWLTAEKQPVKNADLWKRLDSLSEIHKFDWKWLKGHAGHAENERCDILAGLVMDRITAETPQDALKAALSRFQADTTDVTLFVPASKRPGIAPK